MKLKKHEEWVGKNYFMEIDSINLISFSEGKLYLPYIEQLGQLHILFQQKGDFKIYSEESTICLGNYEDNEIQTFPGDPMFDTSPQFVFDPIYRKWWIITTGNIIYPKYA